MSEILVSVVIPAFQCAKYIQHAVDSALMQDVPLEVIVIDDCSYDGLDDVMEQYADEPRVRYIKNDTNLGASATRNKGAALAKGQYIAFLDSDDYWAPDKLKKQLAMIREKGTVLCSTARELITFGGIPTGYVIPTKEEFTFSDLQRQNLINCSSVLIKTEVAREFPMHHDECHEDYLMWLKVLKKYRKACAVNEPLLKYRITDVGKSGSKWKSAKMTYHTYRRMGYGVLRSSYYFINYALHGMKKYFRWFLK